MDTTMEWGESSNMSAHTYKKIELVGSSTIGIEDAVKNAVAKAAPAAA